MHDDALARLEATVHRKLVIGSTETAAEQVLPRLLGTLRDAYPEHTIQFVIDRSTQMTDGIAKGSIDIAVLLGTSPDTPGRQVGQLPLRWFAEPAFEPPPAGGTVRLAAYSEPCGMRQRALAELGEAGYQVEVTAESTSLEGVIGAARAGLGAAVLPSAGHAPAGLVEISGLPPLGVIGLYLAVRRGLDLDLEMTALETVERFFLRLNDSVARPIHRVR